MNAEDTGGISSGRGAWRRLRLSLAALVAVPFGVAACSGGPSTPHVPTGSTIATSASPSAGGGTQARGLLAYASCVRSHGVPRFPDLAGSGGIPKEDPQQLGVSDSQFKAAQSACQHLLPAGGSLSGRSSQTVTAQQQQDYLNAAACMRSHGITNFPDPVFSDGHVTVPIPSSIDNNSPQFIQAAQTCTKLIPAGLPYSGSGS